MSTIAADELAIAVEMNLEAAFELVGAGLPGVELSPVEGLIRYATGVAHPLGNVVVRTRLQADEVEQVARAVVGEYKGLNLPMMWFVGPSSEPAGLSETLNLLKPNSVSDVPGMAADLADVKELPHQQANVRIAEVTGPEVLAEWEQVLCDVFIIPAKVVRMFTSLNLQHNFSTECPIRHFLAYLDDVPVATSSLFPSDGVAGIYCVGTMPNARRRGIGAAITQMAMLEGKKLGLSHAALQSSEAGLKVYEQLGFRTVCDFKRYFFNLPG